MSPNFVLSYHNQQDGLSHRHIQHCCLFYNDTWNNATLVRKLCLLFSWIIRCYRII